MCSAPTTIPTPSPQPRLLSQRLRGYRGPRRRHEARGRPARLHPAPRDRLMGSRAVLPRPGREPRRHRARRPRPALHPERRRRARSPELRGVLAFTARDFPDDETSNAALNARFADQRHPPPAPDRLATATRAPARPGAVATRVTDGDGDRSDVADRQSVLLELDVGLAAGVLLDQPQWPGTRPSRPARLERRSC